MLEKIKNLFLKNNSTKQYSTYEKIEHLFDALQNEVIAIELGEDLLEFKEFVTDNVGTIREQIKDECGFIMPPVELKENYVIQENEFRIYVQDKMVENRYVIPTKDNLAEELYDGLKTTVYNHLDVIFTNELTEKYINAVRKKNDLLIWNVTNILSVIDIKTILSDIIFSGKSINNINYIFEKIGECILSNYEYTICMRQYNPHKIAKEITKTL